MTLQQAHAEVRALVPQPGYICISHRFWDFGGGDIRAEWCVSIPNQQHTSSQLEMAVQLVRESITERPTVEQASAQLEEALS